MFDKEVKMGWLSRLFGAVPKEEMEGIHLDTIGPYWEIKGPKTFVELFPNMRKFIKLNTAVPLTVNKKA